MVRFVLMFLASGFFHEACASDRLVELENPVTLSVDSSSNQRSAESVLSIPGTVADAHNIRIQFSNIRLSPGSKILVEGQADGHDQLLDPVSLVYWQNTSAYFNGTSVRVTLTVPASETARLEVARLMTSQPNTDRLIPRSGRPEPHAILGDDERVASKDPRTGRLMPVGCTGWLASSGVGLTAGHCFEDSRDSVASDVETIEFNVPLSEPDGTPVHPSPLHQYPVGTPVVWTNTGYGKDWAVFPIAMNLTDGASVFESQGFFRLSETEIPFFAPDDTNKISVQVTGYGTVSRPPGTGGGWNARNQTQQTDAGPLVAAPPDAPDYLLIYEADTTEGNSGSPVFYPATGIAVALHTDGCGGIVTGTNCGTSLSNPDLKEALQTYNGPNPVFVDAFNFPVRTTSASPPGTVFNPYRKLEDAIATASPGANLFLVKGGYAGYGITFPAKQLTFHATGGDVTIGPLNPTP